MTQLAFRFDPDRCFGCQGCVGACANVNGTPPDLLWRQVLKLPPEAGSSGTVYLSLACNHCEGAPCVRACPAEALTKRASDGAVLHDATRCLGCRYCQMACSFGAIHWDAVRKVVSKCQLCTDRRDRGREPACVATCFAGALGLAPLTDMEGLPRATPGFLHLPGARPAIRFGGGSGAFPPPCSTVEEP